MSQDTIDFYDAIAEYYPLFFRDWQVQLEREGLGLRAIFRLKGVERVLDTACGVGTQSVPLAKLGYQVTAIDPSPGMLARARVTAAEHGVENDITFIQADFSQLSDVVEGPFDAIVCKGNALPHLLSDEDIELTLLTFHDLLRPGGLLIIGLRDFGPFLEHRPRFLPGLLHADHDENEFITYEIWEWRDGPPIIATQNLYITQGPPDNLKTIKRSVSFRPLSTEEVQVALLEQGYEDITQQPDRWEQVLVARKPLSG